MRDPGEVGFELCGDMAHDAMQRASVMPIANANFFQNDNDNVWGSRWALAGKYHGSGLVFLIIFSFPFFQFAFLSVFVEWTIGCDHHEADEESATACKRFLLIENTRNGRRRQLKGRAHLLKTVPCDEKEYKYAFFSSS